MFPGSLVHVGQTFVHDQEIKFLKQVAGEVGPVFLTQGEFGEAGLKTGDQVEGIDYLCQAV